MNFSNQKPWLPYPSDCIEESDKETYVRTVEECEGIKLAKEGIHKNPGLRSVAKACLNSLWGKLAQKENMGKTVVVKDATKLYRMLESSEIMVTSLLPVNDEVIYVSWCWNAEAQTAQPFTNVVVAAFVTAHAWLKLFPYLEPLGNRALYWDTDSVLFLSNECAGWWEPITGPLLGDLTEELAEYGYGSYITEFVSGGPKFYAFEILTPQNEKEYVRGNELDCAPAHRAAAADQNARGTPGLVAI